METLPVDNDIVLRWPSMADAENLYALIEANCAHLSRWLPWPATATLESERQWIEDRVAAKERGEGSPPLIIFQGRLVGAVGFVSIDHLNRVSEIGYWLAEDAQGRGIVTRACRALLDLAFGQRGLHRCAIRTATGNSRSRTIPERLGSPSRASSGRRNWSTDNVLTWQSTPCLRRSGHG